MDAIIDGAISEPEWLEKETDFWGFRVWHLMFFCFSGVLSVTIMLCCCFRFRIPRTKQEIEADFQRRKIARKFRERLACIKNSEMDDMNLQKALERIRQDFLADSQDVINTMEAPDDGPATATTTTTTTNAAAGGRRHRHEAQNLAKQRVRPGAFV